MITKKDLLSKIERLDKSIGLLSNRIWVLENPSKYEYGDVIKFEGGELKILSCTFMTIRDYPYNIYEYKVDNGISVYTITGQNISALIYNRATKV